MIRFLLNGTEVSPATNWQEVSSTIKKDSEYNLFLLFQEYDLIFVDDGYEYIFNELTTDGFCTEIGITIQSLCLGQWTTIFNGIIFVSDCEINEKNCSIKCKVSDKSFFSKVNNNKNIKTSLDGLYTKNQVSIAASTTYDLDVYNVTANALVRTVPTCRVSEAFSYLIKFMTDNTVSFASTTFGVGGTWEGLCITTGERLRGVTPSINVGQWQPFSFITMFQEINNRIPIVLLVENPFTNPVIRIESLDYLYGSANTFNATDIDEIVTTYDTDKLYALVKFGSPTDTSLSLDFPETINFYGFKDEEFHILGTCNLDQSLDLTSEWVVSSNVIQQVVGSSQDYDSNLFLINSVLTDSVSGRTTNDNFLNVSPARYHYNQLLNNDNISQRYIPEFSNSMAAFYVNTLFGQALGYVPTNFSHNNFLTNEDYTGFLNAESYDYGNNFDTGTGLYTAPQAAVYNVTAQLSITPTTQNGTGFNWYQIWLEHYDDSNTLINTYEIAQPNNFLGSGITNAYWVAGGLNTFAKTLAPTLISMNSGDYLSFRIKSYPDGIPQSGVYLGGQYYTINQGVTNTFLKVIETTIAGGVFNDVNPDDIKVQNHRFNYPMSQSTFETILANPVGKIGFGMNGQNLRYGWIKELKYNHVSQVANFILTTSKSTINAS
jgi:hypothetical protein